MSHVNIKLADLKVRTEHHAHVALEFNRGTKWSEFLCFDSNGPRKEKRLISSFEKEYYRSSAIPVKRAALSFLRAYKRAYIPELGLFEIIMEVYIMSVTESNPKGLSSLGTTELLVVYNELAAVVGKAQLSSFKQGKTLLIKKIETLQAEAAKPTLAQQKAKDSNAAKVEKRLAGLEALKASKPKSSTTPPPPAAKSKATKLISPPAKSSVKAVKPKLNPIKPGKLMRTPIRTGTKAQGIGAFCVELIRKGKDNVEVLNAVKVKFPDSNTSINSIAWYRNKLKSEA